MDGIKRFGWLKTRSAWQDMEYRRVRRAEMLKEDQARMDAVNSAMSGALQNRISQSANNTAEAALKRVQTAAKAKLAETNKQIDAAQKLIETTQKNVPAASGSSSVLDTVA